MIRMAVRLLLSAALVGIGWSVGRAQTTAPEFELVIDAPAGRTNIECVRGCQMAWVERMTPNSVITTQPTFSYECSNSQNRCGSGRIGGWVKR
jgi:hypothetical protein